MQGRARSDRVDAAIEPLLIDMHDQIEPEAPDGLVAKAIISRNFQVVSICSNGNGGFAG